jgi:hypothetical protein
VRTTPSILPNRESGPQNQPKAKVAVSVWAGAAASIGGMATPGAALAAEFGIGFGRLVHPDIRTIPRPNVDISRYNLFFVVSSSFLEIME